MGMGGWVGEGGHPSKDVKVRSSRADCGSRQQMSRADETLRILNTEMFLIFVCVTLHFFL